MVRDFLFHPWRVTDRFQQPLMVELVYPLKGRELHVFQIAPRIAMADDLGLYVLVDDRFGQRVVLRGPSTVYR